MYLTRNYKLETKTERNEYYSIIKNAKLECRENQINGYFEKHHIFPKSIFPEWKRKKSNIVLLTRAEHLYVHKLLKFIFPCKEMSYAYSFMNRIINTNKSISEQLWQDAYYRERVIEGTKKFWNNPENVKQHSLKMKLVHEQNPNIRINATQSTMQPVKNLETGLIFNNMAEAGKWANIKAYCKIGEVCRHKRLHAGHTPDGIPATWEYYGLSKRSQNKIEYYTNCINAVYKVNNRKELYKDKKINGWIGYKSKPVYCITTDKYFKNITLAEKFYGITGIYGVLRNRHPYAGKLNNQPLYWRYATEEEILQNNLK